MSLTIVIDGLSQPSERIISKSDFHQTFEFQCLSELTQNPIHCLSAFWGANDVSKQHALVTPVYIETGSNDARISDTFKSLNIAETDLNTLLIDVRDFLIQEAMHVEYIECGMWLMSFPLETPNFNAPPIDEVMGQSLWPLLKCLDESFYWQRLMTELQMLLSSHPINEQRGLNGLKPINGLWAWGNEVPALNSLKAHVMTDDEQMMQFCQRHNVPARGIDFTSVNKITHIFLRDCSVEKKKALDVLAKQHTTKWCYRDAIHVEKRPAWWRRILKDSL